jgi:hypothetical protein
VSAAKVLACGPVGATLAEVPARTLVAETAIGLSDAISLSGTITLSDAIPCVTRRGATGASLTEISASGIALAKTLLNLPSGRALTDISSRALDPVCYMRVVVAKTAGQARIVYPSVSVTYAGTVEIIPVDEVIVNVDIVTSPSSVPSPAIPASTPDGTKRKSGSPGDETEAGRIVHRWIGISGRTPHRFGIVLRHIDHLRRSGLDGDVVLTVARGGGDCLLRCRLERTILLSSLAHSLDRLHDAVLLRQDGISEIRCPAKVLAQTLQNIRNHYERLDARVPRLFRSRVGQCLTSERGVLLKPPLRLHDLQRVRGCDEHLAKDRVGV